MLQLPDAERFARYLEQQAGEPLVATKERRVRQWGHWGAVYEIKTASGVLIGEYTRYNPAKGKKDGIRHYEGIIPGFVNQAIVKHNNETGDNRDVCIARPLYAEAYNEEGELRNIHGPISKDGFARLDGYPETLPFP